MKYQQVKSLEELQVGDIIRGYSRQLVFVVTANYGSRVTAVRSQDVTNPSEWEVLRPNPTPEQDK